MSEMGFLSRLKNPVKHQNQSTSVMTEEDVVCVVCGKEGPLSEIPWREEVGTLSETWVCKNDDRCNLIYNIWVMEQDYSDLLYEYDRPVLCLMISRRSYMSRSLISSIY
jgi:hypothetical protein